MGAALTISIRGCPYDNMMRIVNAGNYLDEFKFHWPLKDGELTTLQKQRNMLLLRQSEYRNKKDEVFNRQIREIKYILNRCYIKKGMGGKIIAEDTNGPLNVKDYLDLLEV